MLSVKKILVVAAVLGASVVGMSASKAEAGGFGYGYGYGGYYNSYYAPIYARPIYLPSYNYYTPSYGCFGY